MVIGLRPAAREDAAAAEALLQSCGLMGLDGSAQFGPQFMLAFDSETGGDLLGIAGVELHGKEGLLRSVAVVDAARSQGVGARLIADRNYFARFRFRRIPREQAPPAVAASHQWGTACPASAVPMKLAL